MLAPLCIPAPNACIPAPSEPDIVVGASPSPKKSYGNPPCIPRSFVPPAATNEPTFPAIFPPNKLLTELPIPVANSPNVDAFVMF